LSLAEQQRLDEDARPVVAKHLGRWRPHVLDGQPQHKEQPIQQPLPRPVDIKPSMAANTVMG